MCTATVQGIKANLPRGGAASSTPSKNKVQSISISPENKIALNNTEVTIEQLSAQLAQAKAANPAVQVVVKGESLTQYATVVQVLNTLAQLGISQVGLATKASKR
jgi:biopolymer transport protein ExbD